MSNIEDLGEKKKNNSQYSQSLLQDTLVQIYLPTELENGFVFQRFVVKLEIGAHFFTGLYDQYLFNLFQLKPLVT